MSFDTLGRVSRLMYSVFRSQGTKVEAGVGVDGALDANVPPFAYGVEVEAKSPNNAKSLGSSLGGLLGSGFKANNPAKF